MPCSSPPAPSSASLAALVQKPPKKAPKAGAFPFGEPERAHFAENTCLLGIPLPQDGLVLQQLLPGRRAPFSKKSSKARQGLLEGPAAPVSRRLLRLQKPAARQKPASGAAAFFFLACRRGAVGTPQNACSRPSSLSKSRDPLEKPGCGLQKAAAGSLFARDDKGFFSPSGACLSNAALLRGF